MTQMTQMPPDELLYKWFREAQSSETAKFTVELYDDGGYATNAYDVIRRVVEWCEIKELSVSEPTKPAPQEQSIARMNPMTDLFNAKDAKKLTNLNNPNELLKIILDEIKEKAIEGKWEYETRSYGFGESNLYAAEQNYPVKIKEVLRMLRDLGFNAQIITVESQFVDIFLKVTWDT